MWTTKKKIPLDPSSPTPDSLQKCTSRSYSLNVPYHIMCIFKKLPVCRTFNLSSRVTAGQLGRQDYQYLAKITLFNCNRSTVYLRISCFWVFFFDNGLSISVFLTILNHSVALIKNTYNTIQ